MYHLTFDKLALSDIKLVNSFSSYNKISERSKAEKYLLGHEFQVGIDLVKE